MILDLDACFKTLSGEEIKPDTMAKFLANDLTLENSEFHPLRSYKIALDLYNTGKTDITKEDLGIIKKFIENLPASPMISRMPFGKAQLLQVIESVT